MGRFFGFLYGIVAYLIFLSSFLYAVGFVGNVFVVKSIDSGAEGSMLMSIIVNMVLLSIFALQHSVMARPAFKSMWTKVIPKSVERTTYVLLSSLALILICVFWQPMLGNVWDVSGTLVGTSLLFVFWTGWAIVLSSTFMIDHFDLFGLRQVYLHLKEQEDSHAGFQQRVLYRFVRHPIMTGFIIAFWATPVMTTGHLLFAVVTTMYIVIAVKHFEEKDLVAQIGEQYTNYQKEVGTFFPGMGKHKD
jgi:protein-S-isoprenylcysteine O-methyltransferase Ste14